MNRRAAGEAARRSAAGGAWRSSRSPRESSVCAAGGAGASLVTAFSSSAVTATGFSIGTPTMLPHSVQLPS